MSPFQLNQHCATLPALSTGKCHLLPCVCSLSSPWLFTDDSWAMRWQLCPCRQAKLHGCGCRHAHSVPSAGPHGAGSLWHFSWVMLTFLIWLLLEASVSSRVTGEHHENVIDRMPNYQQRYWELGGLCNSSRATDSTLDLPGQAQKPGLVRAPLKDGEGRVASVQTPGPDKRASQLPHSRAAWLQENTSSESALPPFSLSTGDLQCSVSFRCTA